MQQRKSNISSYGWRAFKFLLAIFAFWFVYKKVTEQNESEGYLEQLLKAFQSKETVLILTAVLFLMVANWFLEAMKWKLMIDRLEKISIYRSFEAVCSGLTISIFTPNRIGEFAGRVFHLEKANKIQATIITVIENFSQLLVTLLIGAFASIYYLSHYGEFSTSVNLLIIVTLFVVAIVAMLAFFNIRFLELMLKKFKSPSKWQSTFHVISEYKTSELMNVFLLAFCRYVIFIAQFYLLIRMYGGDIPIFISLVMIAMTYLVITIVPTITLIELGIRGATAAYFFGKINLDVLPVLNAVFSLWIINLAIPALAGAIFMLNFRLEKSSKE